MTKDLPNVLADYGAAWLEPVADTRRALLDACWSDEGVYADPNSMAVGRAALSDLIGGFHAKMPGARIELTSGASAHHERILFSWRMVTAEGATALEGVDFGRLAPDGRLAEITGFFGPPPGGLTGAPRRKLRKTMPQPMTLKTRLADPSARLTMHICTIPSATVTQAIAASGADSVVVDMEHGAVDHASAHAMIAATAGTSCAPMVRVAENDPVQVKRALDLGAEGIVFPMVRTAEEAQRAVASLRYPPHGTRGFGPFIAQSRWGTGLLDHRETVDGSLVCCLLAETAESIENIEAICAVPGVDMIVPAQFDLSTDLGISGQFDHPDFQAALAKVEAAAGKAGIALGNVALSKAQADGLFAKGYRVACGFDVLWLRAAAAEAQSWTG